MNKVMTKPVRVAEVGDKIKSKKGIIGFVEVVSEASVIVKIEEAPIGMEYENNVTVINHKNYKVVK